MKANVDQDKCIGCGLCVSLCAEVFGMNDDGKSEAILNDIPSSEESSAEEAKESCPVEAISIY